MTRHEAIRRSISGAIVAVAALSFSAANAQQSAKPVAGQAVASPEAEPDDIVIAGYRDPAKQPTRVDPPPAISGVANRRLYEFSERLAKCAARSRLSDRSRLRAVVDGEFNSATHAVAQDRLKRIYIGCGISGNILTITGDDSPPSMVISMEHTGGTDGTMPGAPVRTDAAPLGHSIYDRGAFLIQAMKLYAPDLTLTREDTSDPAVQDRFNMRELPRNRFRLPVDYRYFEVAVCMVRMEPTLSVRLAMSGGGAERAGLQAAIVNRARACVGNSPQVRIDATQFRIYIAEAVYRWTVAARNVASLIPVGEG